MCRESSAMNSRREIATYKQHNNYSLQLNRWMLKLIGAWPELSTGTSAARMLSKILQITCHTLIALTVIPAILHIIFEEKELNLRLMAIGPTSHWVMGGINYWSLLYQKKQIHKSIEHMEADWRSVKRDSYRDVMLKNARTGRIIAGICALIMQSGLFAYDISMGVSSMLMVVDNETIAIGRLPCPSFNKFIDTRLSPVYEIILTLQFMSTFVVNDATVGACGLAAVFAMHACGQLDVVISQLQELEMSENVKSIKKNLADLVERHLRTLRFLSRMEVIMRVVCFVELIGCTWNLCMLGYHIITGWHEENPKILMTYFVIFTSMVFNIFIFCYIGDLVTEQCKKVGEAAYMTNWYKLPRDTVLGLILVILRSSIVIKITAGKMFHMSIPTFADVIKTSMAYLNMLRTL